MNDDRDIPAQGDSVSSVQDYEVGFGRPPRATQFKRGRSGNPHGRPKRPRAASAFDEALAEKITVHQDGRKRRLSKEQIIERQIVNNAAKGDRFAIGQYTRRQIARRKDGAELPPITTAPVIFAAVFPPGWEDEDD